jgi:hypothetical protein
MNDDSAKGARAITTSDTAVIPVTSAIRVGTGGTLKVTMSNGDVVAYPTVLSGQRVKISAKVVWQNGTSATGLVAEY